MPEVKVGENRIHYREIKGNSIPLIFIHGAGGDGSLWGYVMKNLRGIHSIALDLPGHGGSSGNPVERIELYADFLQEFLKILDIERCVLAGHSMGGAITLEMAVRKDSKLKGIVLVSTGAKLRVSPLVFHSLSNLESHIDEFVDFLLKDEKLKALIRSSLLKAGAEVLKTDFTACNGFDLMERISEIEIPALILCGDADFMTPLKYSEYMHEKIKNSRFVPFKGAGHMLMLEAPEFVAEEISFFIRDIDG
jgi:pimeloyl-ACP methyl ester carboxylesterase